MVRDCRVTLQFVGTYMRATLNDLDVIDEYANPLFDSAEHEDWLTEKTGNRRWSRQKATNIAERLTTIRYLLYQLRHEAAALNRVVKKTLDTVDDPRR